MHRITNTAGRLARENDDLLKRNKWSSMDVCVLVERLVLQREASVSGRAKEGQEEDVVDTFSVALKLVRALLSLVCN